MEEIVQVYVKQKMIRTKWAEQGDADVCSTSKTYKMLFEQ